jgi:hypothetical protein
MHAEYLQQPILWGLSPRIASKFCFLFSRIVGLSNLGGRMVVHVGEGDESRLL